MSDNMSISVTYKLTDVEGLKDKVRNDEGLYNSFNRLCERYRVTTEEEVSFCLLFDNGSPLGYKVIRKISKQDYDPIEMEQSEVSRVIVHFDGFNREERESE